MNLVNYQPWSILDKVGRLYDDLTPSQFFADDPHSDTNRWVPAVDVREETERYVIIVDLPGVESDNIEITAADGVLEIKGSREREHTDEAEGYKRVERVRGSFSQRFSLPETADGDGIAASSRDGVLEVTIPKHTKPEPRRIPVN